MDKPRLEENYLPDLTQRSEIQGIVASGYRKFPVMSCLLFHIENREKAVQTLKGIQDQISFNDAPSQDKENRLNLAFTWEGLKTLNSAVVDKDTKLFKREFREGMVTPHRQRILGDLDDSPSAPSNWLWGQPEKQKVHLALLVYASDQTHRESQVNELLGTLGLKLVDQGRIDSVPLRNGKEHFGFRDGVSQPWLRGVNKPGPAADEVAWGEVLLGHRDNSGTVERHPGIGLNGSYLAIRQIEQDVQGFWQSFDEADSAQIRLASKQMGRWPDGTPITLKPNGPESEPSNDFDYRHDPRGRNCPVGSHVRRCNPRSGRRRSVGRKDRHRILRRGRAYGAPAPAKHFPKQLRSDVSAGDEASSGDARGLIFMCLNANLERQFEFMQQNWINSPMIGTLSDELDPIASQLDFELFTIPTKPIRKRCPRPKSYVKTVGGGYFFLPSRSAIHTILN